MSRDFMVSVVAPTAAVTAVVMAIVTKFMGLW